MKSVAFRAYCPSCGDVCIAHHEPDRGLVCSNCGTKVMGVAERQPKARRAGRICGAIWSVVRRIWHP